MASIEYHLYRIKFIQPAQKSFLNADLSAEQLFISALNEKLAVELIESYTWHIGNVTFFDKSTGYFAAGRTSNATVEKFDYDSGNFIEEELETSPYTHCVFNTRLGLLGIAKKTTLARTVRGIANQLERLFTYASLNQENGVRVEISPIPDPESFVSSLRTAYAVTKFSATFHGPNPIDADHFFQKPLAVYLNLANGKEGKTEIKGTDLNKDVLESVTRSTAATGNQASARIIREHGHRPITVNLNGDAIKKSYDEDNHVPAAIIKDLTKLYDTIRQDETH